MTDMAGTYDWKVAQKLHSSGIPFDALIFAAILKADTQNMENLLIGFPHLVAEANQHYHGMTNINLSEVEKLSQQYEQFEEDSKRLLETPTTVHFWESGCPLDGRQDEHTHPHDEWKAHLDRQGK